MKQILKKRLFELEKKTGVNTKKITIIRILVNKNKKPVWAIVRGKPDIKMTYEEYLKSNYCTLTSKTT